MSQNEIDKMINYILQITPNKKKGHKRKHWSKPKKDIYNRMTNMFVVPKIDIV